MKQNNFTIDEKAYFFDNIWLHLCKEPIDTDAQYAKTLNPILRRMLLRIDKWTKEVPEYTELFEQFWALYPRKVSKKLACSAWNRAIKETTPKNIFDKISLMKERRLKKKQRKEFVEEIKHPATRLNQWCWDDEYTIDTFEEKNRVPEEQNKNQKSSFLDTVEDLF